MGDAQKEKEMKKTAIPTFVCIICFTFGLSANMNWAGVPIFDLDNQIQLPTDNFGLATAIADFNQDGFDDMVSFNNNLGITHVVLNQSGKGFTIVLQLQNSAGGGGSSWWRPADVNGDGFPDLINSHSDGIDVLINALGPGYACAADLTGDGSVEVNDLLFVVSEWGPCE
jgi:hypothetical protein